MKKMNLQEIQTETKKLLSAFDKLCSRLGIEYFLAYGTLLGAVRHKGFIPWDDDIDVGMMYDDYMILKKYFLENKDKDMELHCPDLVPGVYYNISRVCEKKHRLIFDNKKYESGLFIDIYIFEGMGQDEDSAYWDKQFKKIRKWRKRIFMCENTSFLYGENLFTKIANIPIVLLAKIRGKEYYFSLLNSHKKFDLESSKYVGVPKWETDRFPKSVFQEVVRTQFEDIEVNIPSEYEPFLKQRYGDYMKLPEENARIPHHGYDAYKDIL